MAMWITVLGVLSVSLFQPTQRACFLVKGYHNQFLLAGGELARGAGKTARGRCGGHSFRICIDVVWV
jgi:hypothetical protein